MNEQLYKENILDHYRHPRNYGKLAEATFTGNSVNPWCGDEISFFVRFDLRGAVEAAGFEGAGCAISQAAASLLTDFLKNKTAPELSAITHIDIMNLLGVVVGPGRVDCATLALKALKKGLDEYARA